MIIYEKGDLFKQINRVEAIINTVNCVGVMGKGIALEFKKRYPENFQLYKTKCAKKELTIGNSFVYEIPNSDTTNFIINFPTKKHWRNPSKIEYIEEGLDNLIKLLVEYNIKSLAMPALGCGNGNLDWNNVKPLIEKKLQPLKNVKIFIFEPSTIKEEKEKNTKKRPRLTQDRKKLLLLMNDYNTATKGPMVSYIQTHIISYFINFNKKNINFELREKGPFLKELNKVIILLSQYYIKPIENNEPNQPKQIEILNVNFPQKNEILKDPDYLIIKSLISGFETYDSLLTLSITHWFKFNENINSNEIPSRVFSWLEKNNHKPNKTLINNSMNRLERLYLNSENLSMDFS
ncbi:macro domain-containing protein [Rossellomorea sp. SC111]|uniref:type II toxin-antitoxin system antitoxin DNA ADP-ribosyl glycohydrolase DarG n=1 Tax=Rossellomorea sp. SC111 TaxID=2968985 RepID=UPI00215B1FA5|nr:macro domain-containing protein [Rossellomorea sp. SC111]MCR8848156.1 macro domain-containing protein [Rossellomorea sp. SC111]